MRKTETRPNKKKEAEGACSGRRTGSADAKKKPPKSGDRVVARASGARQPKGALTTCLNRTQTGREATHVV
jgi:hypothetical protein